MKYAPPEINLLRSGNAVQAATDHLSGRQLGILWVPAILLLAIICIPLPFPTGLPLIALALSVLLNQSRRARVLYVRAKRKLNPEGKFYAGFCKVDRLLRVKYRRK